jgi:xanthine dehydrogenase molybdenum-binding subunit
MSLKIVGKSVQRLDAVEKVTGRARYSEDFFERDMLVGKVLRSPFAHARVKRIDASRAKALPGVEAVLTPADLPKIKFPTAGHPWALDPAHRDVADRLILTDQTRFVGDAVAAVVAVDALTAEQALRLIEVEYEELPFVLTAEDALKEGAPVLHEERPDNVVSSFGTQYGDIDAALAAADRVFEGRFETSIVQHCHLEPQTAFAFVDGHGRIVVNTSTQIPHIVRRIVAQALGLRWGKVQVIKPYIGGGFGAKQDVVIEPLVAAMTLAVHGRPVRCTFTREEVFIDSRTRHSMKIHLRIAASREGKLQGIEVNVLSNTGAYASHGHSIAMSTGAKFRPLYWFPNFRFRPKTVYTNLPVAGAMRGYGVPQMFFALESLMEDIARELKLDPIEFRKQNLIGVGFQDPLTKNVVRSFGIPECIARGKALIRWDEKKREYARQTGPRRRGVGMACFSYASGTHPVGLELAGARIVMHQDGSVTLQVGATEIGQGSDTVFAQIVAEVLGLGIDMVNVVTVQDTDTAPFDTGAYASRQTFVTGIAVRKAALEARAKVLAIASRKCGLAPGELDLQDGEVVEKALGRPVCSLEEVAMESYYDRIHADPIKSDVSANVRINAMSYGVTFIAVEVDQETGKIEVLELYNVHDSGRIINPQLAEGQVHGGVSMALGYALLEQMLFDPRTGKALNNNLLDYKLPTILDTPKIHAEFV